MVDIPQSEILILHSNGMLSVIFFFIIPLSLPPSLSLSFHPLPAHSWVIDIDSLLTTLRSLGAEGDGGEMDGKEGERGLRLLEQMLHSNTFKRAQKVCVVCISCTEIACPTMHVFYSEFLAMHVVHVLSCA